jgi:drug/metabolite transporter (DMT)-like permease
MYSTILFIIFIIIILIYYYYYKNIELFTIKTWTPYIIDYNNQPGYTNYFYNNGYMYPIY